jgi:hypothetical protein
MSSKSRPALLSMSTSSSSPSAVLPQEASRTERGRLGGHSSRSWAVRVLDYVQPLLTSKHGVAFAIGISVLLSAASLLLGFTADDHFHALSLAPSGSFRGVDRAPWDLFAFAKNPQTNLALMEEGAFPWWTDRELVIAFLRPLSSLSLWLDYQLWPGSAFAMHLHSLVWYAGLLGAAALVYRGILGGSAVAVLALLIYGIDDARSMPVAWIAHRNALVALTPAFLALAAHHAHRVSGKVRYGLLGPLLFAVGLAGGEPALPVFGYLFAYALFMDNGSLKSRVLSLAPYALLVLSWRGLYNHLGYGALHSGVYLDPAREPVAFATALFTRLPVLLLSQFAMPIADLWEIYPLFVPFMQPLVLAFAYVALTALFVVLRPMLRADAAARFWLVGAVLATIPVCGTHPEDRVLTATSLGGAAVVARFLMALRDGTYPRATRPIEAVGGVFCAVHLIAAPVLFPARVLAVDKMEAMMLRADALLPKASALAGETLVMMNPPVDLLAVYWPVFREARGLGRPAHFRWLATGESAIAVSRVDAHTLRIRPESGFLSSASQQMFRRAERSLARGEQVRLEGSTFTITDLTPDGRPAEAEVSFELPLDHPSLHFVQWGTHEYVPFSVPQAGQSVLIPAVDMKTALIEDPGPAPSSHPIHDAR